MKVKSRELSFSPNQHSALTMLSSETISIIRATLPAVREHGVAVTNAFYDNLLNDAPQLNEIFNRANQANGHQARALAAAVCAYAENIENPDILAPTLEHINHKHASLFIKPEQYDVVGKYLLDAFAQILGDAFTDEVRNAWAAAYGELANMMINAEAKLYRRAEDWTDWRDFVIKGKIPESSEITSFMLGSVNRDRLPTYLPGQYVSIRVFVPSLGYSQPRQYSLSDVHHVDRYRISVKKEAGIGTNPVAHPGLVSNTLHSMKTGDIIQLSRPYGDFSLDTNHNTSSPICLISAGVGVTPLISMLNTSVESNAERPIAWIQGFRNGQAGAFACQIDRLAKSHHSIRVLRFCSQPCTQDRLGVDYDRVGRVDLRECDDDGHLFLNDVSTRYFVCGPDAFMSQVRKQLEDRGVHPYQILTERFGTGGV